ncbi:hypothetical protein M422DRAFT_194292 [Sphaerobolus stellatus SS14]|uniref:Glycerol-3-phosphate dehydrogenase [NAD(+)] n=1 Tax=Sphaerobolus stellatus (strain SS14) TaxID=990650 RepID=A0A0C9U6N5_SPHS4|nr:hypothetical protein M422DRAFT_194292 [Sphaerobolus stellatus SS14]
MEHIQCDKKKVCIFGSGNFGSCLADHLADAVHDVLLWSRDTEVIEALNSTHMHPYCHKDHVFPEGIRAVGPEMLSTEALREMDVLLFAVPTEGLRETLTKLKPTIDQILKFDEDGEVKSPVFIFVNKGIESKSNALTLEIVAEAVGKEVARAAAFLSGPSFATEIIRRQPTNVSVSSLSQSHAQQAADLFHQPWFRCYTGTDPIGVELAGALKNVYAIAAGCAEGLGYENNTRAGLVTRALAEMSRIGTAYGANPLTFLTLAGVGDLFLTCSSKTSRNFTVGYRLGKGEKLDDILRTLGSVAEGVATAKGAKMMIDKLGINAPIAQGVYGVLYEGVEAEAQARWLMERPAVAEIDLSCDVGIAAKELLAKLGL